MDITSAGEVARTITADYVMTGIMLFIFLISSGYLIKVIKAIIKDNKAHIVELNASHQSQINTLIENHQARLDEMNSRYQSSVESMNKKLLDLNRQAMETQKELITTIKENNEIILQHSGVSIRLETSVTSLLSTIKDFAKP